MNRTSITTALCALTLAVALTGCHSSRKAYRDPSIGLEASTADTRTLYTQLVESYADWSDYYAPITVSVASGGMSISGRATMVYGQSINISLRMLGMEVAVAYIDNDNAYIVDKYHKYYIREDLSALSSQYGVTLVDIQNLLLGKASVPGSGVVSRATFDDFDYLSADGQWLMVPTRQPRDAQWSYAVTATQPPVLSALSMRVAGYGTVELKYSQPTSTPSGMTASAMTITAQDNDRRMVVTLAYDAEGAKWNEGRQTNFKEPGAGYKRMRLAELLGSFGIK